MIRTLFFILAFAAQTAIGATNSMHLVYPVAGLPIASFSNTMASVAGLLPSDAKYAAFYVRETGKSIVVTWFVEATSQNQLTQARFDRLDGEWALSGTIPRRGRHMGISFGELQTLLKEHADIFPSDAAVLFFSFNRNNTFQILTGGQGARLAGHGTGYIFEKKKGRWIFVKAGKWRS